MTYRFLIVDDEYYVRQHIHHCIDWESLGFQYAGEAGNVSSALEFLQKKSCGAAASGYIHAWTKRTGSFKKSFSG